MLPASLRDGATVALGVLLVASVVLNGWLAWSLRSSLAMNGALRASFEAQKQTTIAAKTANDRLSELLRETIADKQRILSEYTRDRRQAEQEVLGREREIRELENRAAEERRLRHATESTTPDCAAFLDSRLGDYCPDLANRVRERTETNPNGM